MRTTNGDGGIIEQVIIEYAFDRKGKGISKKVKGHNLIGKTFAITGTTSCTWFEAACLFCPRAKK